MAEYLKQWRKDNPEKMKQYSDNAKEYNHQWRMDNPEYMKEYMENWWKINPEYKKQWAKNNPDKIRRYAKSQKPRNKDNPRYKQWYKDNKERIGEYRRHWVNLKYRTDLKFNLNYRIRGAVGIALKGNKAGRHWENLVGYTLNDLIKKLKRTMPEGYTWQDFIDGELHIDHIIPISAHNFTKPEHTDFKRCWALKNLQLLPAKENNIKRAKLKKPFQLALQIEEVIL